MERSSFYEELKKIYKDVVSHSSEKLVSVLRLKEEEVIPEDTGLKRFLKRAQCIAEFLIDDLGVFQKKNLEELCSSFEAEGNLFHPFGLNDPFFIGHLKVQLNFLLNSEGFLKKIRLFEPPVCHSLAEEVILLSLGPEKKGPLLGVQIKRAVLSALLVPLRQNVGSCFATAPAIYVQRDFPEMLLDDLYQLLFTGRLKRVIAGVEHVVPFTFSKPDGIYHPLLKAWEFTIASFSEVKMEFSSWNLYVSLGLHPEERGGLGKVIVESCEEMLEKTREKLKGLAEQHTAAMLRVQSVENILRGASDDSQVRRLKAELQAHLYHARSLEEMHAGENEKGKVIAELVPKLLKQYHLFFPLYFQEVFDPNLVEKMGNSYGDSPAGFRLLYKHGRSDPTLWERIYDAKQYVASLIDFFTATEKLILSALEWKEGEECLEKITTELITYLRSPLFIETAFQRIQKAHHDKTRTPWCYVSGGTLETLSKTYFRRESQITEESRVMESPSDLAIFLVELLKNTRIRKIPERFLASSPEHAFLVLPYLSPFYEGWQESGFTYTWVRDQIFLPAEKFYAEITLSTFQKRFLLQRLGLRSFPDIPHSKIIPWRSQVLLHGVDPSKLDHLLLKSLPLTSKEQVPAWISRLLEPFDLDPLKIPEMSEEYLTSEELKELAKLLYIQSVKKVALGVDLHTEIEKRARFLGLSPPPPLLFGDSNWDTYFLGCLVNPGTGNLELWRLNFLGTSGFPMTPWRSSFGGEGAPSWSFYLSNNY